MVLGNGERMNKVVMSVCGPEKIASLVAGMKLNHYGVTEGLSPDTVSFGGSDVGPRGQSETPTYVEIMHFWGPLKCIF